MSRQEIFDHVINGLASQCFEQSVIPPKPNTMNQHEVCAYRGEEDRKCAVGFLIKDEYYDPKFEHTEASTLLEDTSLADIWEYDVTDWMTRHLLENLQQAHDDCEDPIEMRKRLRIIADSFDLQTPMVLWKENDPEPENEDG